MWSKLKPSHWISIGILPFIMCVGSLWALFSSDPMVPFLLHRFGGVTVEPFSALWIAIPLVLLTLAIIWWDVKKDPLKSVMKKLRPLRLKGVQLRNEVQSDVRSVGDLENWISRATAWRGKVEKQVGKFSDAWAGHIEVLNTLDGSHVAVTHQVPGVVEGLEHQRWADIQHQRLARLEEFISDPQGNPPAPAPKHDQSGSGPSTEFVSMNEAAQQVYTIVRDEKHWLQPIVESDHPSPDGILDNVATQIASFQAVNVTVYGKRPPSLQTERIDPTDLSDCKFVDSATRLQGLFNQDLCFTDLTIKREDLGRLIVQIGFESGYSQE